MSGIKDICGGSSSVLMPSATVLHRLGHGPILCERNEARDQRYIGKHLSWGSLVSAGAILIAVWALVVLVVRASVAATRIYTAIIYFGLESQQERDTAS